MAKQKVYLAGGFRSNWQDKIISELSDNFDFLNPRDHGLTEPNLYSAWDIHYVRNCDILFGYMELTNPSGYGLAFEIGLASGLNKTIILVDEKSDSSIEFANYFKLVRFPCSATFNNLPQAIDFLKRFSIN